MKFSTFFKTCALALCAVSAANTVHADTVRWNHDVSTTYAFSQKSGKPMLVIVGASWCPACRELEASTLGDPQFKRAAQRWECAHLDADAQENAPFMVQMGIRELPSIVMLSPQGKPLGKVIGYVGPGALAQYLDTAARPYTVRPVAKAPTVQRVPVAKTAKTPIRQSWSQMAEVKNARSQPNYSGALLLTEDGAIPLDAPTPTAKKKAPVASKSVSKKRVK